jgi:glycine cleavage system T protein (aminomethyltransferase)
MSASNDLAHTPLHDLHKSLGGKMVAFAGYEMPVQYPLGVLKEHLHTRAEAGLFDVSHMGQIKISPKSGNHIDAALALETVLPIDVQKLAPGRQRYALLTNDNGGILDDLMVANRDDHFFLVVNAACKDADLKHLEERLSDSCVLETLPDRGLIALQGPQAEAALASLAPDCAAMRFMDVVSLSIAGSECFVSRSGYTGEDGFEISIPGHATVQIAEALLAHPDVEPIGLGARDSLRLEAGLCLYGTDLDKTMTPVEGALEWAMQKSRRRGGAAAGGFPGDKIILDQLEAGADRRRVGLKPEGRAPVRGGTLLYAGEATEDVVGTVSSGGFGPSVGHPVSMGVVATNLSEPGTELFAEVRGKRMPVAVAKLPFIPANFKRN